MEHTEKKEKVLGILCGGGPAPGMNSVISSVTIEAYNRGFDRVIGFLEGFKHLVRGVKSHHKVLKIGDVSRIQKTGGSIIQTSRVNPSKGDKKHTAEEKMANVVEVFKELGVNYLVTIGGEDTAGSSFNIANHAKKTGYHMQTVHVPKTIDNDLPLPKGIPTFGFETARALGTEVVQILDEDARTTNRWYIVVCMGRKAGHLSLGIGKSAAVALTLIPEEFKRPVDMKDIVDIICTTIFKKKVDGENYGTVVVAEGFMEMEGFLKDIKDLPWDHEHDHPMLGEIDFSRLIKTEVEKRLEQLGTEMRLIAKDVGYELRCANPIPFDIEYTRNLGYAAVDFLVGGGSHAIISVQGDTIVPIPIEELVDPRTKKVGVRMVDTDSINFRIAKQYMIRLLPEDITDPEKLADISKAAGMTPEKFKNEFAYLVMGEKVAEFK